MAKTSENISRPGEYGDSLAQEALEGVANETPAQDPATAAPEPELEPIEKWRAALKEAGITEEQAGTILDSMLSKGYWEREYRLFYGKVVLKLRTRDAQNINRIMSAIDQMRMPTPAMVDEAIALLNLSGSIVQLRDVTLPHPDALKATVDDIETAFDQRRAFVARIPGPLMPAIRKALVHFDQVVAAALANGAIEGF